MFCHIFVYTVRNMYVFFVILTDRIFQCSTFNYPPEGTVDDSDQIFTLKSC